MNLEAITIEESERLNNLEHVVLGYKPELIKVANALLEIRDSRLYRSEFKSFGDYCKAKFGFGKSRGYQLIDFAVQVHNVDSDSAPENESQARKRKAKENTRVPSSSEDQESDRRQPSCMGGLHQGNATLVQGVTAGETAPLSTCSEQPRIVSGVQAEGLATSVEPSPAPTDYASELIDYAELALMKAPVDQLQRIAVYASALTRKAKEAIAARKERQAA